MLFRSIIFLLLAIGPGLSPASAQKPDQQKESEQDETISVETNLVVLNVTIKDSKDRHVSGIKPEEFKVFEDKFPQRIMSLSIEETPFTAAILLDASGSMEKKLTLARAACASFIDGIRVGDTYAIYSFGGTKVKKLQDFTEVRDVPDSVWDMRAEGNTPLYDAIVNASEALANRPEKRRAILIVTDGADTQSRASLDQTIRKALAANVSIYAVDLSDAAVYGSKPSDSGAEVMKAIAAKTGGRFYRSPGGSNLRDAFASTVDELRHQYTITYDSSNSRFDGKWREIEVRVTRPQLIIHTRQGYYARKKQS
jgi:Ca-activated chloride channel homolog